MKNKKPPSKKKKSQPFKVSPGFLTDTSAGETWLSTLSEPEFRDKILERLYIKMKKEGAIESFENIHGRNDKGIDYLLAETTLLKRRIVGVQVKSKVITRTGDSTSLSSLDVKRECEGAMDHEFIFQRDKVRLDNIELWTSAHITEDAEREFVAPGGRVKIQVTKAATVFGWLERFCPDLVAKIPQCTLAHYLKGKSNPKPKGFKLLGVPLHPRRNFLLPRLSRNDTSSIARLTRQNKKVIPRKETILLDAIVRTPSHALIKGSDLSGKTYLLEHLQCLFAESYILPFMLTGAHFTENVRSIYSVLSKVIGTLSPNDVAEVVKSNRVVVLIDDFDELEKHRQDELLCLDPNEITVLGTARSSYICSRMEQYYIAGVDFESIPRFLRSLDQTGKGITFTDRAHSFISRSLASSGLPDSPFTVAMLLEHCQLTNTEFSTPTMGRLIERFIEQQLGSHSDNAYSVDFESKREFLTRLAGNPNLKLTVSGVKRLLQKHIPSRSLPHNPDTFFSDLMTCGVFTIDDADGALVWSHPVIKQFFWVKSLVLKDKLDPIRRILTTSMEPTIAAIAGSQLKNAVKLIDPLIALISKLKLPSREELVRAVREVSPDLLPSLTEEDALLQRIERLENDDRFAETETKKAAETISEWELTEEERARLRNDMAPVFEKLMSNKFHVGTNLAALVINSRDTRTVDKERCVREVLRSNSRFASWLEEVLRVGLKGKPNTERVISWVRLFTLFQVTDMMLGDPFLLSVFRDLLKGKNSDDETIMLLDLILGCGEESENAVLVKKLRKFNRPELTCGIYYRVIYLYFFRYHREKEKVSLRRLLTELRKVHDFVPLPLV